MTFDKKKYWAEKNRRKELRAQMAETEISKLTKMPVPTKKAREAHAEMSKIYMADKGIMGITPAEAVGQQPGHHEPRTRKEWRRHEVPGRGRRRRTGEVAA